MAYKSKYTSAEIENKLDLVYNKYFNPVVPDEPVEPEPLPLGVFIQHVDGSLYTADEWTAKGFASADANGVAVSAEECAFVIAKEAAVSKSWSTDSKNIVNGIVATNSEAVALTDYLGEHNTTLMTATDTKYAGYYCANYTFPNGKKGYLAALGEWKIVCQNITDIDASFVLLGCGAISDKFFWSSTQYSSTEAWGVALWRKGYGEQNKGNSNSVLPFTTLD